jgi:hypothetical protein
MFSFQFQKKIHEVIYFQCSQTSCYNSEKFSSDSCMGVMIFFKAHFQFFSPCNHMVFTHIKAFG